MSDQVKQKLTAISEAGGIYCNICTETIFKKQEFDAHYKKHIIGSGDIQYTCAICFKEFTSYSQLRNHCYGSHVIKYTFKCDQCPAKYKKQYYLTQHIEKIHKTIFKCQPPCNKKFSSQKELEIHQVIHKDSTSIICKKCDTALPTIHVCESHMEEHAYIEYTCPICSELFIDKPSATKHVTVHFSDISTEDTKDECEVQDDCSIDFLGGILCKLCCSTLKNRQEFESHFCDEHPNQSPEYTCVICSKSYESYSLFGGHCYDHAVKGKFKCDTCELCFYRPSILVAHKESCNQSQLRLWPCNRCPLKYGYRKELQNHKREKHNEMESYMCSVLSCGATFDKVRDLAIHKMSHTNLDNWCRGCGLQFTVLGSCTDHLDVHRKNIYTCTICDINYTEKHHLNKHIPKHFETTLHVCNLCGKTFTARNRLLEHIKFHEEKKPHVCEYCCKGFAKLYTYKQHLNIHLQYKPNECSFCSRSFGNYSNLCKHLRKVHRIDPKTKRPLRNYNNNVTNKTMESNKTIKKANETIDATKAEKIKENKAQDKCLKGVDETMDQINVLYTILPAEPVRDPQTEFRPTQNQNTNIQIMNPSYTNEFQNDVQGDYDKNSNNILENIKDEEINLKHIISKAIEMLEQENLDRNVKSDGITNLSNDNIYQNVSENETYVYAELKNSPKIIKPVPFAAPYITKLNAQNEENNYIGDAAATEAQMYSLQRWSNSTLCPTEYGPDFIDDHYLPHIDPTLTTISKSSDDLLLSNVDLNPLPFDSDDLSFQGIFNSIGMRRKADVTRIFRMEMSNATCQIPY